MRRQTGFTLIEVLVAVL
ncbi:MAG: prepilin-type N-terminal cleavage/methylation domain-containing protein, partial [Methylohalobius sp.]